MNDLNFSIHGAQIFRIAGEDNDRWLIDHIASIIPEAIKEPSSSYTMDLDWVGSDGKLYQRGYQIYLKHLLESYYSDGKLCKQDYGIPAYNHTDIISMIRKQLPFGTPCFSIRIEFNKKHYHYLFYYYEKKS
jgi:hypothetical protein